MDQTWKNLITLEKKKGSHLEKWVSLKLGKRLHFEKWVTLGREGQTCKKNGSQTPGKMGHT